VDDSPFFRNMLSPMLTIAGYDVMSVQSGQEALGLCNAGEKFDVIISDIEMPDMNGYEFAQKVKAGDSKWKGVPLVALSSHATAQDLDRGKAAGFNDYIAKFDRDALLRSISQISTQTGEAA
jgi:two-component system chemotaxis sensor kinase CheA